MRVLSSAFYRLKTIIPWVPHDTKLSKLDTLRLARNYIAYLTSTLDGEPVEEITNKMPHPQKMVSENTLIIFNSIYCLNRKTSRWIFSQKKISFSFFLFLCFKEHLTSFHSGCHYSYGFFTSLISLRHNTNCSINKLSNTFLNEGIFSVGKVHRRNFQKLNYLFDGFDLIL